MNGSWHENREEKYRDFIHVDMLKAVCRERIPPRSVRTIARVYSIPCAG